MDKSRDKIITGMCFYIIETRKIQTDSTMDVWQIPGLEYGTKNWYVPYLTNRFLMIEDHKIFYLVHILQYVFPEGEGRKGMYFFTKFKIQKKSL